jgi:hypothetical protein
MGLFSKLFGKKEEPSAVDISKLAKEESKKAVNVCEDVAANTSSPKQKTIVIKTGMSEAARTVVQKPEQPKPKPAPVAPQVPPTPKAKPLPEGKWPSKVKFSRIGGGRTFATRFELAKSRFPEYDFYTGDVEQSKIDEAKEALDSVFGDVQVFLEKGYQAETIQNYEAAAAIYEQLVCNEYWEADVYKRLMSIYKRAGMIQAYNSLLRYSYKFFKNKRDNDRENVLKLARKYEQSRWTERQIAGGYRIGYFDGIFDLYNPYPYVEIWRDEVDQLATN